MEDIEMLKDISTRIVTIVENVICILESRNESARVARGAAEDPRYIWVVL
jgi:hypothetical protein